MICWHFLQKKVKTVKIGKSLRETRLAAGVVSESFYSKVERGIHNIDADTLVKLLKARKINPEGFFNQAIKMAGNKKNTASNR